jgi:HNH endonuclease
MYRNRTTLVTVLTNTRIDAQSGCWFWLGCKDKDGYGQVRFQQKQCRTHRFVYEFLYGTLPQGTVVCHRCDQPSCINPEHLFSGTIGDNVRDMVSKNRNVGNTKLSKEQRQEILNLRLSGVPQNVLAKQFNVTRTTIQEITNIYTYPKLGKVRPVKISRDCVSYKFKSVTESAEYLGVKGNTVSQAAKKGHKCKGYQVEYI